MPSSPFKKRMRDEKYKKIAFLEQQIGILRKDLERLEKTLEEVKIINDKLELPNA